jgi:uncharacterized protein DUF1769
MRFLRRKKSRHLPVMTAPSSVHGVDSEVSEGNEFVVPSKTLDECTDTFAKMHDLPSPIDYNYPKRLYIQCSSLNEPNASQDGLTNLAYINDDYHPQLINNDYFTGQVVFRVRDFNGVVPVDPVTQQSKQVIPTTEYFQGHKRAFSLQMSGRFKHAWTADDVLFGTFFERPLTLPRGYSIALSLARRIDSSMVTELDRPDPYMCSPLICAMNVFNVHPLWSTTNITNGTEAKARGPSEIIEEFGFKSNAAPRPEPLPMPRWEFGGKKQLTEQVITEWYGTGQAQAGLRHARHATLPDIMADHLDKSRSLGHSASHRRSYFLKEEHRKRFIYHPDTVYSFDFFSPYVDLNRMQLKLGISIDVLYYLNGNPLRYQCRSRDGKVTFFTIEVGVI